MSENHPKNYQTFPITPWYTEKNSYLTIFRPFDDKKFKCNHPYTFKMVIKTDNSDLFSELIYFQIQTRSNFSFIGFYDIQNEKLTVQSEKNEIFFHVKLVEKILNSKDSSDQSK